MSDLDQSLYLLYEGPVAGIELLIEETMLKFWHRHARRHPVKTSKVPTGATRRPPKAALHAAIEDINYNPRYVEELVYQGADLYAEDTYGRTPAMCALGVNIMPPRPLGNKQSEPESDCLKMMPLPISMHALGVLVRGGWDVNSRSSGSAGRYTILQYARFHDEQFAIISFLLANGLDLDKPYNCSGDMLWHFLALKGFDTTLSGLFPYFENGVDCVSMKEHKTALHLANWSSPWLTTFLITQGANLELKDSRGRTALLDAFYLAVCGIDEEFVSFKILFKATHPNLRGDLKYQIKKMKEDWVQAGEQWNEKEDCPIKPLQAYA